MTPETLQFLRGFLPTLNAGFNAVCAVLLVCGYWAVRSRRTALHKTCMLLALTVSALFLTSYLFYHFGVIRGQHIPYHERVPQAPDWVVEVYYAILWSHLLPGAGRGAPGLDHGLPGLAWHVSPSCPPGSLDTAHLVVCFRDRRRRVLDAVSSLVASGFSHHR